MNYTTIKLFSSWGMLTPSLGWYRENNFLTDDQYKEIAGANYKPTEA